MSAAGEPRATLPEAENSAPFDACIKRFESAWRQAPPPSIEDHLPTDPIQRKAVLIELVHIDLEMRLKRGEAARVETYLATYPALADEPDVVVELLTEEYGFRTRKEPSLRADEFFNRFPTLAGKLREQLPAGATVGRRAGEAGITQSQTAPRPLSAVCPHCGERIELTDHEPLSRIRCPNCKRSFSLLLEETVDKRAGGAVAPRMLAHFALLEKLGEGGFGTVWKAHDTQLDRMVAIKFPRRGQLAAQEVEQFFREARSAARLRHPFIVSVHEVGREGSVVYIVSDFIDGMPLDEMLRKRRPAQREAVELCVKVADALDHSHRAGVIHRDLKPGNILLDASGGPHVTDFGLARRETSEATMTVQGQVLGTPAYMSPEQAQGEAHTADGRTDIYSLGVVLFELLTGERPFRGNARMILQQVVEDDPPSPRKFDSAIPRDLETLTLKCLSKDPARRYATAADVSAELQRFLAGEPILARPVGQAERFWRWCRRQPVVAGLTGAVAALLLTVAIVATAGYFRESELRVSVQSQRDEADRARIGEKTARDAAEQHAKDLQKALLNNLIVRGLTEFDADSMTSGVANLGQAYGMIPRGDPLRKNLRALILDRATRAGHWTTPPLWHDAQVWAAAFSPDGKRVVTGSEDKTARLWDAATGQPLGIVLRHQDAVLAVAFSADGRRVATASRDKTAQVWDTNAGKPVFEPMQHAGPVTVVAFGSDGRRLVTASLNRAQLWDATNGKPVGKSLQHDKMVLAVAFSPSGERVATTSSDKTARVWDTDTGTPVGDIMRHEADVVAVVFSRSGARIATASYDTTARIWDANAGKPLITLRGHQDWVYSVAFSPDGKWIATGSVDKTARLWNADTGAPIGETMRHGGSVNSVEFSPNGNELLTISQNVAQIWNLLTGQPPGEPLRRERVLRSAAFSPDGQRIVTTGLGRSAELWLVTPQRNVGLPMRHDAQVLNAIFSPDGRRVATGSWDKTARLWSAATGKPLSAPLRHPSPVNNLAFSPNSRTLATVSQDKTVRLWDAATGQPVGEPMRHKGEVFLLMFSRDNRRVITASSDNIVGLWDAASGKPIGPPLRPNAAVIAVQLARDDRLLKTVSLDNRVQTWDVAAGKPIGQSLRHEGTISRAMFSPDSRRILTVSPDHTARMSDAATGAPLGRPLIQDGQMAAALFSPDGQRIVTRTENIAQLWDVATCQPLGGPIAHDTPLLAVVFSHDSQRMATSCQDRAVRVWDAATGGRLGEPLRHARNVPKVYFSPDGNRVLTPCNDFYARLWDVSPPLALPDDEGLADAVLDLFSGLNLNRRPAPAPLTPQEIADRWSMLETRAGPWLAQFRERNAPRALKDQEMQHGR